MTKEKSNTKKPNRGGPRPGAGRRPKTTKTDSATISIQKNTRNLLNKLKYTQNFETIDALILALIKDL